MKEITEFFSGLGTHIDPAVVIPAAIAVIVFAAVYFLFRKKEVPPETVAKEQSEAVPAEPEEAEPPSEPPASELPPAEVSEPAVESQFTAPKPAVAEEKEVAAPSPDPVTAAEPIEVAEEPALPKETEVEPEELKAEEEPEENKVAQEPEEEVFAEEKEDDAEGDFFSRLSIGLSKTRRGLLQNLEHVFSSGKIDDASWMSSRRYS